MLYFFVLVDSQGSQSSIDPCTALFSSFEIVGTPSTNLQLSLSLLQTQFIRMFHCDPELNALHAGAAKDSSWAERPNKDSSWAERPNKDSSWAERPDKDLNLALCSFVQLVCSSVVNNIL